MSGPSATGSGRTRETLLIRPLDPDNVGDVRELANLIAADPGYASRATGRTPQPGDAESLLRDGPRDLPPRHKVVLGAFQPAGGAAPTGALVAVVDLLRGWPRPATTHVGLLQVHADLHGRGLGRIVHENLLKWVTTHWPETITIRAVIVETNADQAAPFWQALGYQPSGDPLPYRDGSLHTTAQAWALPVTSPAHAAHDEAPPPPTPPVDTQGAP
jgi:GNAT superfamily N-acetyltransferase